MTCVAQKRLCLSSPLSRATFNFYVLLDLSYLASVLCTRVKLTCVRTQNVRDSGNPPLRCSGRNNNILTQTIIAQRDLREGGWRGKGRERNKKKKKQAINENVFLRIVSFWVWAFRAENQIFCRTFPPVLHLTPPPDPPHTKYFINSLN